MKSTETRRTGRINAQTDTIAALSSGAVPSGVAVIRVSGPNARHSVEAITRRPPPAPGRVELRRFRSGDDVIDRGLVLWFEAPRSFTGEDVAEFHTHGGRAVTDGLLDALIKVGGIRFAEAGEFSKQAFRNGRLDLTAVEGLSDLIQAQTSLQRRQAFRQFDGGLESLYETWRKRLMGALAHVEATIDFSDEDLPDDVLAQVKPVLAGLMAELEGHLAGADLGERLRDGFRVAIYGPPNAGKSSLLNRLARRDVAIVSDQPGTTRDFLEVHLDLHGIPVTVVDTAGIRETEDEVERLGVERASAQVQEADVRLLILDGAAGRKGDIPARWQGVEPDVTIYNKVDLIDGATTAGRKSSGNADRNALWISAERGDGLEILLERIEDRLSDTVNAATDVVPTRLRHREALGVCLESLKRADPEAGLDVEILAEELRAAAVALGRITGRVDVEDMLDLVFRDFCIGK